MKAFQSKIYGYNNMRLNFLWWQTCMRIINYDTIIEIMWCTINSCFSISYFHLVYKNKIGVQEKFFTQNPRLINMFEIFEDFPLQIKNLRDILSYLIIITFFYSIACPGLT